MKKKVIFVTIIFLIIALFICANTSYALTPDDFKNNKIDYKNDELDAIISATEKEVIRVGMFISVGTLMVIGVKYLLSSVEGRANYKTSLVPWVLGATLLFGASTIYEPIKAIINNGVGDTEVQIYNVILGYIQLFGSIIAVAGLMIVGIKRMVSSVDSKVNASQSLLPWVIGLIILYAATSITKYLYNDLYLKDHEDVFAIEINEIYKNNV